MELPRQEVVPSQSLLDSDPQHADDDEAARVEVDNVRELR